MGQRFQTFIKTYNPVIKLEKAYKTKGENYWSNNPDDSEQALNQINHYKQALGENETTILAYHNQWLYGRSALIAGSNVISFNKLSCDHDNPFKPNNGYNAEETLNVIRFVLSMFTSPLAKNIDRFGLEPFRLLNFTETAISDDFTWVIIMMGYAS